VTFRLSATNATRVEVTFAASPAELVRGAGTTLEMRPAGGGVWVATTAPLPPDIYAYRFTRDGTSTNDPLNPRFIEEFAGDRTSAFAIPGALWTTTGAPEGRVTRHSYTSATIGAVEEYVVYTPAGYDDRPTTLYPTLYLLHGMGDNAFTWVTNGGVDVTLNTSIAAATAAPMVVVMPLAYGGSGATLIDHDAFERALLQEIIPLIEKRYRISRDRRARAIAGVSMGGAQALSIGLRHAGTFAWLASLSGAFGDDAPALPPAIERDRFALIYLGWGASDTLAAGNRRVVADLLGRGARPRTNEVPGMGHVWPLWRRMIADLLQVLFR
jgi:enterochelin esterase family protein